MPHRYVRRGAAGKGRGRRASKGQRALAFLRNPPQTVKFARRHRVIRRRAANSQALVLGLCEIVQPCRCRPAVVAAGGLSRRLWRQSSAAQRGRWTRKAAGGGVDQPSGPAHIPRDGVVVADQIAPAQSVQSPPRVGCKLPAQSIICSAWRSVLTCVRRDTRSAITLSSAFVGSLPGRPSVPTDGVAKAWRCDRRWRHQRRDNAPCRQRTLTHIRPISSPRPRVSGSVHAVAPTT